MKTQVTLTKPALSPPPRPELDLRAFVRLNLPPTGFQDKGPKPENWFSLEYDGDRLYNDCVNNYVSDHFSPYRRLRTRIADNLRSKYFQSEILHNTPDIIALFPPNKAQSCGNYANFFEAWFACVVEHIANWEYGKRNPLKDWIEKCLHIRCKNLLRYSIQRKYHRYGYFGEVKFKPPIEVKMDTPVIQQWFNLSVENAKKASNIVLGYEVYAYSGDIECEGFGFDAMAAKINAQENLFGLLHCTAFMVYSKQ